MTPEEFGKSYPGMNEIMEAVLVIEDPVDACRFALDYIAYLNDDPDRVASWGRKTAEQVMQESIGYWFGYYDEPEKYEMWMRCVGVLHPILGAYLYKLSAGEIFKRGLAAGEEARARLS